MPEKKYIYTYQTKNLINGKTYIGVHTTDKLNDGYIGCGIRSQSYAKSAYKRSRTIPIVNAVVKHGYNNFRMEILSFWDTKEEAYEEESFLVDDNWIKSPDNYNVSLGGNGGDLGEEVNKGRRGEKSTNSKITDAQGEEVLRLSNTHSLKEIPALTGIPYSTVSKIVTKATWKHLKTKTSYEKQPYKKLNSENVTLLRQLFLKGEKSMTDLKIMMEVSSSTTISNAIRYKSWSAQDLDIKGQVMDTYKSKTYAGIE